MVRIEVYDKIPANVILIREFEPGYTKANTFGKHTQQIFDGILEMVGDNKTIIITNKGEIK